jgi:YHS domain-containing protein
MIVWGGNPPQERNKSARIEAANGAVCGPFPPFARRCTMSRIHTTSALTIALMIGLGTAAYAANGQFGNMCSWGLANHKDVQTDCSVNATIKGKTYCFSSADAKSQFMKNPSNNLTKAESFYKSEHKG